MFRTKDHITCGLVVTERLKPLQLSKRSASVGLSIVIDSWLQLFPDISSDVAAVTFIRALTNIRVMFPLYAINVKSSMCEKCESICTIETTGCSLTFCGI